MREVRENVCVFDIVKHARYEYRQIMRLAKRELREQKRVAYETFNRLEENCTHPKNGYEMYDCPAWRARNVILDRAFSSFDRIKAEATAMYKRAKLDAKMGLVARIVKSGD